MYEINDPKWNANYLVYMGAYDVENKLLPVCLDIVNLDGIKNVYMMRFRDLIDGREFHFFGNSDYLENEILKAIQYYGSNRIIVKPNGMAFRDSEFRKLMFACEQSEELTRDLVWSKAYEIGIGYTLQRRRKKQGDF